jgi:hypothetical protein
MCNFCIMCSVSTGLSFWNMLSAHSNGCCLMLKYLNGSRVHGGNKRQSGLIQDDAVFE